MNSHTRIGIGLIIFSLALIGMLAFIKADIDKQGVFMCELVESNPQLSMEDCPAHHNKTSWFIVGAFGIAFFIMASGAYLVLSKKEKTRPVNTSRLDRTEKQVYDLLKKNEGSMYQSDIIKETGFSKVKTTRILDKMEAKRIIDRKRRGMTNIVVLK